MLLQPLPGETAPFPPRVADFYRGKGYQVRENARVRGESGMVYAVDLVATGPLGALLVSFGDAGGVDGPELGRVRKIARDVGATPVIAAPELPPELRRLAAQFGVVVVDAAALVDPNPIPDVSPAFGSDAVRRDLEAHPWPASGRARPEPDAHEPPVEVAGPWRATAPPTPAATADDLLADTPTPTHAPAAAPAGSLLSAAPAKPAPKFSWLQGPAMPEVEPVAAPATPLVASVMGRTPVPVPEGGIRGAAGPVPLDEAAVEHEAVLVARRPTLGERVQDFAHQNADRGSLLKFSVGALVGAGLLFLAIRSLA